MTNLNEQVSTNTNVHAEQIATILDAICPYQERKYAFPEDIELTLSENGTGCFFKCKVCKGASCTGFLRDD